MDALTSQIMRHEGYRRFPYHCSAGKLTIGFGRNLDDVGISHKEAAVLLRNDIFKSRMELKANKREIWDGLTPLRKDVLTNMCFNLGWPKLGGFKRMWLAIERGAYDVAAAEMLNSKWAKQVGQRANELAGQMADG